LFIPNSKEENMNKHIRTRRVVAVLTTVVLYGLSVKIAAYGAALWQWQENEGLETKWLDNVHPGPGNYIVVAPHPTFWSSPVIWGHWILAIPLLIAVVVVAATTILLFKAVVDFVIFRAQAYMAIRFMRHTAS
jgi:hypothetical protein